jgi:hypothetical protein
MVVLPRNESPDVDDRAGTASLTELRRRRVVQNIFRLFCSVMLGLAL